MKRVVAGLVAAMFAVVGDAIAQTAYKAGEYKYTRSQALHLTIDMNGQANTSTVATDEKLTLSLVAKGRDTLDYTLRVDSVSASSDGNSMGRRGGGGLLGMLGSGRNSDLEGQALRGAMAPNGRFHDEATAPIAARALRQFLIVLPAALRVGAVWSDTMPPIMLPFAGPNIDGSRIAETEVLRDTTYAGQRAWKLRRTVSMWLQTNGAMGGAGSPNTSVYAEGTGEGTFYISATGIFLGGTDYLDINLTATLGNGLTLPVTLRQENTVLLVR